MLRAALLTFERDDDAYEAATTLGNLAAILQRRGDLQAAEQMNRRALETKERILGPGHPELATTMSNLAATLYAQGRPEEAAPLMRRALALAEAALRPDHPNLAALRANLERVEAG